jgi:hypothetical protein
MCAPEAGYGLHFARGADKGIRDRFALGKRLGSFALVTGGGGKVVWKEVQGRWLVLAPPYESLVMSLHLFWRLAIWRLAPAPAVVTQIFHLSFK